MADPYPNVDEFGAGACTCGGTYTGCAVCQCANMLIRWGKPVPRLPDGTPNMRALGIAMGTRHRLAVAGNRHGLSLDGQCTGGTNWCAYCVYLQLHAQGVPVAYGQLTWDQIAAQIRAFHPVVMPGWYGRVPLVSESSYSKTIPAKGRSDSGFIGTHMVTAWGTISASFIVTDSDFGSASRPIVPPHSIWSATVLNKFWTALGWTVCYATQRPPSFTPPPTTNLWGPDVPASIRVLDPTGKRTADAFTKVGHQTPGGPFSFGSVIEMADIAAAYRRLGWKYSAPNASNVALLLKWAESH